MNHLTRRQFAALSGVFGAAAFAPSALAQDVTEKVDIDLRKGNIGVFFRDQAIGFGKRVAGFAPFCPEVDQNHMVLGDDIIEIGGG